MRITLIYWKSTYHGNTIITGLTSFNSECSASGCTISPAISITPIIVIVRVCVVGVIVVMLCKVWAVLLPVPIISIMETTLASLPLLTLPRLLLLLRWFIPWLFPSATLTLQSLYVCLILLQHWYLKLLHTPLWCRPHLSHLGSFPLYP